MSALFTAGRRQRLSDCGLFSAWGRLPQTWRCLRKGQVHCAVDVCCCAGEEWTEVADGTETWTDIAAGSEVWATVTTGSEVWLQQ